ncbi:MAG: sigma-70 family RNA polymerase sigma factor [Ignavibacteriales bacterium]
MEWSYFPPALCEEEQEAYIARLQYGDKEARAMLIQGNLRLVAYIAQRFLSTGIDYDDLVSEGTIGLIKAVDTFKVEKNIKLSTYSTRCIENEILMYLKKNRKKIGEMSLEEPIYIHPDGSETFLFDAIKCDVDIEREIVEQELIKRLNQVIGKLSEKYRTVIGYRFGLNDSKIITQKETADIVGTSQAYISRVEKKVVKKIKERFTSEDMILLSEFLRTRDRDLTVVFVTTDTQNGSKKSKKADT